MPYTVLVEPVIVTPVPEHSTTERGTPLVNDSDAAAGFISSSLIAVPDVFRTVSPNRPSG